MLRNKNTDKDKEILAYVRELDKLHLINRHAPFVPIDKPYQNGWIKKFTLRDDYTRRTDAEVYWTMLDKINGIAFCRNKNFLNRDRKEYGPVLKVIGKNEWNGLGWPEHYKKYFCFGRWRVGDYGTVEGYKFDRAFCFVETIEPHIVTKVRVMYPEVEKRLREIRNIFEQNRFWERHSNLKGRRKCSSDYRLSRDRYLNKLSSKEIEEYDKSQ